MAEKQRVLYLLRHGGGCGWRKPFGDINRPLSRAGKKRIDQLKAHFEKHPVHPELVFCSKAKRARQTYELLQPYFSNARVVYHDYLYMASEYSLLELLNMIDDSICCVLFLGHETSLMNFIYFASKEKQENIHVGPATMVALMLSYEKGWQGFNYKQATYQEIYVP